MSMPFNRSFDLMKNAEFYARRGICRNKKILHFRFCERSRDLAADNFIRDFDAAELCGQANRRSLT